MDIKDKVRQKLTFQQLDAVLDGASTKISFWGPRQVRVPKFTGCTSVNFVAEHTLFKLARLHSGSSEKEREYAKKIVAKIDNFYSETDKKIASCNFLTRFFNWIREGNRHSRKKVRGSWEADAKRCLEMHLSPKELSKPNMQEQVSSDTTLPVKSLKEVKPDRMDYTPESFNRAPFLNEENSSASSSNNRLKDDLSSPLYCPKKFNRTLAIDRSAPLLISLLPESGNKSAPAYEVKVKKLEGPLITSDFQIRDYHSEGEILEFLIDCRTKGNPEVQALWDEKTSRLYLVGGKTDPNIDVNEKESLAPKIEQAWIRINLEQLKTHQALAIYGRLPEICGVDSSDQTFTIPESDAQIMLYLFE